MKSFSSIGWTTKSGILSLKVSTLAIISTVAVSSAIIVNEVYKSQKQKKALEKVINPAGISIEKSTFHSDFDDILFSPIITDIIDKGENEKPLANKVIASNKTIRLSDEEISEYLNNSSQAPPIKEIIIPIINEKEEQPKSSSFNFSQEDMEYFSKYGVERNIVSASFRGDDLNWENYIEKHLKYPQSAIKNEMEGTVVVKFEVGEDGSISNAFVSKSISKSLDEEALRLVNNFPNWNSKRVNDQKVRSILKIPVRFELQ